jgi:hypothetical protein
MMMHGFDDGKRCSVVDFSMHALPFDDAKQHFGPNVSNTFKLEIIISFVVSLKPNFGFT